MKYQEFYIKYKTSYPPIVSPIFSKKNWWRIVLIAAVAVLVEPLIIYRRYRNIPFSLHSYLQLIEYLLFIAVPFFAFLFWINRREVIKRKRGYGWEGKFEVTGKRSFFGFCYLWLFPGKDHKVKVDRVLFEKIRVGDFVTIQRDALGNIEKVTKVNNFLSRLTKAKRFPKSVGKRSADKV